MTATGRFARIDRAGLLWLLNGDKLVELTQTTATIETATGERQTWRNREACHRAFDAVGWRWVAEALAGGMLTADALRAAMPQRACCFWAQFRPRRYPWLENPTLSHQRRASGKLPSCSTTC